MKKPNLTTKFGHYYLLWFEPSNTYSCIDAVFYEHLQVFFECVGKADFYHKLCARYDLELELAEWQYERLQSYLSSCQQEAEADALPSKSPKPPETPQYQGRYQIGNSLIAMNFSHKDLLDMMHPLIAHLEAPSSAQATVSFSILLEDQKLYLYRTNKLLKVVAYKEYHKLQGALLMQLINAQHQQEEKHWLGLFHASAVAKNEQALLLFGASGSGKSTLTSLLAAHGFELLADDLVPMLAADQKLYQNPAAVNIKEESYEIIEAFWPHSGTYAERIHTKGKGTSRYIPMHTHLESKGYACQHLIKVRYQKDSTASLEPLDFKEGLETLIPEAWLHPEKSNAQAFMQWLGTVSFFELTYSDFKEALPLLEQLSH
jgi:hypothetical protein